MRRKWQQLSNVTKVSLMNDNVSFVESNMGDSVAHLVEIDLQDNLLYKWSEVCGFLSCNLILTAE